MPDAGGMGPLKSSLSPTTRASQAGSMAYTIESQA